MEIINILKDIRNGYLPLEEIPGFLAWMFGRVAWAFILLAVCGLTVILLNK